MAVMEIPDEVSRKTLDEAMQALAKLFAAQVTALGPERGRQAFELLTQGGKVRYQIEFSPLKMSCSVLVEGKGFFPIFEVDGGEVVVVEQDRPAN